MYIAQRILSALLVIAGTLVLVFAILYVLPGDPTDSMIDPSVATAEQIANLKHQLGVDQPFYIQFIRYISDMVQGDFGYSLLNSEPVLDKILEHFPATLALTAAAR